MMMTKAKRRWMTLIEVLIASSLLTILLTVLLGVYYHVSANYAEVQKVHQEAFKRRYMQNRLTQIFANIPETWIHKKKGIIFTSQNALGTIGNSLIFAFDNRADSTPTLSGYSYGHLHVNPQHQLCLVIWSAEKADDKSDMLPPIVMKQEVLLYDVDSIAFQFYAPPKDPSADYTTLQALPIFDSWNLNIWKKEYPAFPAIIQLAVTTTTGSQAYEYQFVLPYIKSNILYRK
jgi:hypothetical protein